MGRNEEFTRAWTQVQNTVSSYIHAIVRDYHAAEDLVQEVAVVALRKYDDYDQTRPFGAWVIGIARFKILEQRRRYARGFLVFDSDLTATIGDTYSEMSDELDERRPHLKHCIEQIPARHRESLRLFYEDGLPADRIAERLGRTVGAVRTMLSRLRSSLQRCITQRAREVSA